MYLLKNLQLAFFRQHNCDTTDTQLKYKSRAAQLYRDKLSHAASQAMRLHGTKVRIPVIYIHKRNMALYIFIILATYEHKGLVAVWQAWAR